MKQCDSPLKNMLLTAAFWILQLAALFASNYIMYIGSEDTGRTDGSGFLPITLYEPNMLFLITGIILSFAAFAAIWFLLMRGTWTLGRHWHVVWTVIWIVEALLGLFLAFMVIVIADVLRFDLFSRMEPDIMMTYTMVYYIAVILLITIDCTVMTKKRN